MNIEKLRNLLRDVLEVYEDEVTFTGSLAQRVEESLDELETEIDNSILWADIPEQYRVVFELKEGGRLYTRHAITSCATTDNCLLRKDGTAYSVPFGAVTHLIKSKGKNR